MHKNPTPLYALEIDQAIAQLHSSRQGLSSHEAARRLTEHGPNTLPNQKTSWLKRLIEPFASVFVGMLLVALILSLLSGHQSDAIIIGLIVGVNAVIYYAQQLSVDRALQTLQRHDITEVPVVRDGRTTALPSEQLTYGDIVHLSEGLRLPADGRIILASQLECDEAVLSGESLPVHKHAAALSGDIPLYNQKNMVFKGTYVRSGSGIMLVTGIGRDTELGRISTLATKAVDGASPIEQKINTLIGRLVVTVCVVALATLLLSMYRGVAVEDAVRFALAIVVSAVPEGLPVALTIVLLLSARRMAHANALVKKMASIETMGAVTLIATDKTGTITENHLTVADKHTTHPTLNTFDQLVRASLNNHGDHSSDSLDEILLSSVKHAPMPASWSKIRDFSFDQGLRLSGVLWQREHDYLLVVKGAPETILDHCLLRHKRDSHTRAALIALTESGNRTIAFAHKSFHRAIEELNATTLADLGLDGFVALNDQIRANVAVAVRDAQRAGIKVVMLTGDHVATAGFIARQVGIAHGEHDVTDSTVLQSNNPDNIRESLRTMHVYARVLPEHKYALLQATKGHEITAMTGDGVNDIPALVEADAGIAMGSSSDAAKDASDIVLLDNNFHSIVAAIRIGRTALANIRKMIMYLLGTSLGEVMTMLIALICSWPLPVAAMQILWINLVTDGFTVIPLGLSPSEERQMLIPPRSPRTPLLNARQLSRVLVMGITISASVLWMYHLNLSHGRQYAQTLAFLSLIVVQWANALNANFEYKSWVHNLARPNYKLLAAISASALLQVVVFVTPLGALLQITAVSASDALVAIIVPCTVVLAAVDLHKFIYRRPSKKRLT